MKRYSELYNRFPLLKEDELLASYTTFRIGGRSKYFLVVQKREDLIDALSICRKENIPWFILGGGSNMLISSLGFDGLAIKNEMSSIETRGNDMIWAESGVMLATVLKVAKEHGLQGLAKLHGVPGTFGGAVRGNAGVPGCEMGAFVVEATILDELGHVKVVPQSYFQYEYRYSVFKHSKEIILDTTIRLMPGGDPDAIGQEMLEMLKGRKAKQPWGSSGGSYFKNPKEYAAGFLVDQVHGKGMAVGDAMISEKHGNFFLNAGQATSMDIQKLAEQVKRKVLYKYGILLEEEVEFIGKKHFSAHLLDHPILKWFVVILLVILGIIGCILPVMPGVIFFIIAAYIIAPKSSEIIEGWFIRLRRLLGAKDEDV